MSKDNKEFNLSKVAKKHNKHPLIGLTLISQMGIYVLICIFMCFYLGVFLDSFLKTGYIFKVFFLIFGVGSAFIGVYKMAMKEISLAKSDSDYLNTKK